MTSNPQSRQTPLEVLHLSMPRTGSVSMKAAYEELGLPTYHGFVYIEHQEHQILWLKAIEAKFYGKGKPFGKKEFDSFLGEWAVLSDFPVLGFTEELLKVYPDVSKLPKVEVKACHRCVPSFGSNINHLNVTLIRLKSYLSTETSTAGTTHSTRGSSVPSTHGKPGLC
jgi:hypothetical protein